MSDELIDWNKGDPLSAAHLQQPVTALRRMLTMPDAQAPRVPSAAESLGFRFIVTLGVIVDHGPNGESDLTDERYWVKPQYIQGATQRDDPITLNDVAPPDEYTGESVFPDQNILAVTNLSELQHGTHGLEVGQYVWFFKVADGEDDPVEHAVMSEGNLLPGLLFAVNLSSDGGAIGTQTTASTWTYTATDINGTSLGTTLSPQVSRPHGELTAASYGQGYYNSSGTFVLQYAFEIPNTGGC